MNAVIEAFKESAARQGFEDVNVIFSPFTDMKLKWVRGFNLIHFDLPDYLKDLPGDIAREFADSLWDTIQGTKGVQYPQSLRDYLDSAEFVERNRPTYIKRLRGFDTEDTGRIDEAMQYLADRDLLRVDNVTVGWTSRRIAGSSRIFRVVAVPKVDGVSTKLLASVIYHELCRIELSWNQDKEAYKELLSRFEEVTE